MSRLPSKRALSVFTRVVIEGVPKETIGEELNIKPSSVGDIVNRVRQWMHKHGARWDDIAEHERRAAIVCELYVARLDHQWQEAMNAWYRSQQPQTIDKATYKEGGGVKQAEMTRKSQVGDVRFLREAAVLLDKIAAIRGRAPLNVAASSQTPTASVEERRVGYLQLLADYGVGMADVRRNDE
jgi:hypothetical protein